MNEYELYHWGIRGMKWGVRRYQNPDGSLTEEGKRRYRLDSKGNYIKRSRAERKAYDADKKAKALAALQKHIKSPRDKDINFLTDKQLQKYIDRMTNEKNALELRNRVRDLDPKPVSRGKKFMTELMDRVVYPVTKDAGNRLMNAIIDKAMKKDNSPDQYSLARKEAEYWKNMNTAQQQKKQYYKSISSKNDNENG